MLQTPPKIVSTKDLLYLKDQMSWELLAMKKCYHYEQMVSCQQIKDTLHRVGMMHQRHYQILLQHTQNNNTAALSQAQQQMQMAQQNQQNQQKQQGQQSSF